jgi:hypothetical protein
MDTATQINNLLLQLDRAALALTTPQHPDIEVHLEIDCTAPGAAGIVDCELTETHKAGSLVEATLTPIHSHCVKCGAIFTIPHGTHEIYCPSCASPHWVPDTRPV